MLIKDYILSNKWDKKIKYSKEVFNHKVKNIFKL